MSSRVLPSQNPVGKSIESTVPSDHLLINPGKTPWKYRRSSTPGLGLRRYRLARLIGGPVGNDGPGDSRQLVGQRTGDHI